MTTFNNAQLCVVGSSTSGTANEVHVICCKRFHLIIQYVVLIAVLHFTGCMRCWWLCGFLNCVQLFGENGPNLQKCVSVIRKKKEN